LKVVDIYPMGRNKGKVGFLRAYYYKKEGMEFVRIIEISTGKDFLDIDVPVVSDLSGNKFLVLTYLDKHYQEFRECLTRHKFPGKYLENEKETFQFLIK